MLLPAVSTAAVPQRPLGGNGRPGRRQRRLHARPRAVFRTRATVDAGDDDDGVPVGPVDRQPPVLAHAGNNDHVSRLARGRDGFEPRRELVDRGSLRHG